MKKNDEFLKAYHQKMDSDQLQQYLAFKKKGYSVPSKKGKGSYSRKNSKNIDTDNS